MSRRRRLIAQNIDERIENAQILMKRLQIQHTEHFREYVREVFMRVVENTPQMSGLAAANWRIGLNAPSTEYDPDAGAFPAQQWGSHRDAWKQKGDRAAIEYAMAELDKINQITPSTKVYITNTAQNKDGVHYLDAIQHNWRTHLRAANLPYEIAAISAKLVAEEWTVVGRRSNYRYRSRRKVGEGT